jgi:hypothetical protein
MDAATLFVIVTMSDGRERLECLLAGGDADLLRFSEAFDDPVMLKF